MFNYSINKSFFVLVCEDEIKELQNISRFLHLLDKSGVGNIINEYIKSNTNGGRPQYNPYNMLSLILYSFAFSSGSLRDIEEKCVYDIRYKYIANNITPSYVSISNFINDVIMPNIDKIYSSITKTIFEECNINMDDSFIDGSKFEADANKYKFVWKPTKFHIRLSDKIRELLLKYNLHNAIPKEGIIDSKIVAKKVLEFHKFLSKNNIGNYVKYFNWEGNVSGKNPSQYQINDDMTITCLNGEIGTIITDINRHPKKANAVFYKTTECNDSSFKNYCKRYMKDKEQNEKIFEVVI